MPGVLKYLLVGFGIVFTLAVLSLIAVNTAPGRAFVATETEKAVANAIGGSVEISGLSGVLPWNISIQEIVVRDDKGPWVTIENAAIDWRPFALLTFNELNIDRIVITEINLIRRPQPKEAVNYNERPRSLSLPSELPKLAIDKISIKTIKTRIGSRQSILNADGAIQTRGNRIKGNFSVADSTGNDRAIAEIEIDPSRDLFNLRADISISDNGAIAPVLELDGGAVLTITTLPAPGGSTISIAGAIGNIGAIDTAILIDPKALNFADVAGTFEAGARFSTFNELSEPLSFAFLVQEKNGGGELDIRKLTSAMGEINGVVKWRQANDFLDGFSAKLNASLNESYRPTVQKFAGEKFVLETAIEKQRNTYALTTALFNDDLKINLHDARTDFQTILRGAVEINAAPNGTIAILDDGALASANISVDADELTLNDLKIEIGGTTLGGHASYLLVDDLVSSEVEIQVAPQTVTAFGPAIEPTDFMSFNVVASGNIDDLSLSITGVTPQIAINDVMSPPLAIRADLENIPHRSKGVISANATNADGAFLMNFDTPTGDVIRASPIAYSGDGFRFKGFGSYGLQNRAVTFDAEYRGEERAMPWPGISLSGDFSVSGRYSVSDEPAKFNAAATHLSINKNRIDGLTIAAAGPPSAIDLSISANEISGPSAAPIQNLKIDALVKNERDASVILRSASAVVADLDATLTQPANIEFKEGVTLNGFRMRWGDNGSVAIDAGVSATRWRADIALREIFVPDTDSSATIKLKLDTNGDQPAQGTFTLRSLLLEENASSLWGTFSWDGKNLKIVDTPGENILDMNISVPVNLSRSPAISITAEGPIDGFVKYDGAIENLAAYMPPDFQSISGDFSANFDFGGKLSAPQIVGKLMLNDGVFTEPRSGLSIAGINIDVAANQNDAGRNLSIIGTARGGAQSTGDTISLEGDVVLGEAASLDLMIALRQAEFAAFPVQNVKASGAVKLSGLLDEITIESAINIDELNAEIISPETNGLAPIEVVSINDHLQQSASNEPTPVSSAIKYDLNISADDRIFVRGRGLESEWSAAVNLVTQRNTPILTGAMNLRRGWLDFSGRRFSFTRGSIAFDRLQPNNPSLDIRAEYATNDGITAVVAVSGRANEPEIELTSSPVLPSEDVMAIILFGKAAQDLSAIESLQAAEALAALSGIGPFGGEGVSGALRRATGLDLLNFDADAQNGGGSLTIGKYVTDGLFISGTQDAKGENGSVRLQYELNDNVVIESEVEQTGNQTVSANWKKDF